MKNILILFAVFVSGSLHAQYYYNDIIGTSETSQQMKTYIANKVLSVRATGTYPGGMTATDFSELQEVKENGKALKITTRNNTNLTIYYNRFDNLGRLISITDSSSDIQSVSTYEYDANGRIVIVKNVTKDTANNFNQTEIHKWLYNSEGKPQKMLRTINDSDSLEIRFTPDEDGNTGDEKTYRRDKETGTVYYYYDDKNRLSDIVRYNTKAKKLLPDIMFEYDDNNRVIQKITTTSSLSLGYLIWRYLFDEKGLKTKEALFNKDKELTGKIDYNYSFSQ
ncbi:MAG: RHS repeat domain-containing protein [Chitinophagaceae bacterium]